MARAHVSPAPTVQMMSRVQPWGTLPELEWRRPWTERNVSGAELFVDGAASGGESHEHLYFMEPLSHLPEPLRRALAPGLTTLATPFQPVAETNAWAGRPGVSSPLHYDAAHNVYAQLVGHKRFLLMPAEQSRLLHPFPRLHPSSRQSQINLRAVPLDGRYARFLAALGAAAGDGNAPLSSTSAATPAVEALRAYEVVLGPGDTLYIPPYVWHRASVTGSSTAFSVAAYTQSSAMMAYDLLKSHPLPVAPVARSVSAAWSGGGGGLRRDTEYARVWRQLRAYCLALGALRPPSLGWSHVVDDGFACAVTGACACAHDGDSGEAAGARALRELHAARFAPLLLPPVTAPSDEHAYIRSGGGNVHVEQVEALAPALPEMLRHARAELHSHGEPPPSPTPPSPSLPPPPPPPPSPPSSERSMFAHAHALREAVARLPMRGALPPAVWQLELDSLVEDVASGVLGARHAEAFIHWAAGDVGSGTLK